MATRTILLLEDEALIAMDLSLELESQGFRVIDTRTIPEAIEAIAAHAIDVAILDLDIKGTQTTTVAEDLRARRIPFVVCSGSQLEQIAEVFTGVPAIAKPYRPEELHSTLHRALGAAA
jgi:CheY-like chemotaxis protein